MRRKFTTLCLALVGALMASPVFAQGENVTFKLKNADMEQGLKGWTRDGVDLMEKNKKDVSSRVGFHGMNQGVLETWHYSSDNPVGDSYVMQRVKGLPNGTYVFGAYVGAASQVRNQTECNHETIQGVSLFANEAVVPVATCNPDLGHTSNVKWGHSSKFNVAAQVVDGTLEVGLRIEGTNANYVVWDNATLYYFGDMSEEDALDAMAEMDMTHAVAIADTLVSVKMNVDTLANLQMAITTAKSATSTAATLWADNEDLYWWVGKARKSEVDYKNLDKDIKAAKVIRGGTWTQGSTLALLTVLDAAIASAEQAYAEATLDRAGLTALRKELSWAAGDVKVDSVYAAKNDLYAFILELTRVLNRPGGYTSVQLESLSNLDSELTAALNPYKYEMDAKLPLEERTINPNNLISYIERVYTAIENVRNNPIANEYTKMPIELKAGEDGWIEGTEMYNQSLDIVAYTSPLYMFKSSVETFRITVYNAQKDQDFFCLSGLEFYDRYGAKIELDEFDVKTNADHNELNSTPDGDGIPALFDNDEATYFHSAWKNGPSEDHYLEVTLPNGGYDAFSFKMVGRAKNGVHLQSHTFPGKMIVSTPMPKRDALVATFNEAKAQYPLSGAAEPGFYKADFSALNRKIAEVEEALEGYPSEDECTAMDNTLRALMEEFNAADHSVYMPEVGKAYRIVSALPAFYENQGVQKAITVNHVDTLWWENIDAANSQQEFVFEPIYDEEDKHLARYGEYLYTMQHVNTGLYVAYDENNLFVLADTPDSVVLKPLGLGQFNIKVCDSIKEDEEGVISWNYRPLHIGDHNNGNATAVPGPYGGAESLKGVNSVLVSYEAGINSPSAWYIREMAEMPWTVAAGNATDYRSEYIHMYEPASTIYLTAANKNCAFEGLTIYDLFGNIVPATVEVKGREATVVLETEVTSFSFALNNKEKIKMFSINTLESHPLTKLQVAYDAAVAVAPVKGTGVGEYADLSEYEAALAYAEPLLAGDASDEMMLGAIEKLNEAVANLVPNKPDPNRLYYIVSAADEFMQIQGAEMMVYVNDESVVGWTYANTIDANRHWQFEQVEDTYYLKNVSTNKYLGYKVEGDVLSAMFEERSQAIPFVVSVVQNDVVTIAPVDRQGYSLHMESHDLGNGKSGEIIYYYNSVGESQWRLCEVDAYELDYAMYMFRANAKAGESVKVAVELENPEAVTAVEFDLCLPEGVTLEGVGVDNVRVPADCIVGSTLQGDNVYRISLEMNEGTLVGYSGAVFNLTLKTAGNMAEGEYAINLSNIVVTTMAGEEATIADFVSSIVVTKPGDATCIDAVETTARIYGVDGAVVAVCDADMQLGVYTMGGQLVKQWSVMPGKNTMALPAGIYLISGKKVIVK